MIILFVNNPEPKEKDWKTRFDEYLKPKVFCGKGYCTGLWNIQCDDLKHPDGRELCTISKVKSFIQQLIKEEKIKLVEEEEKIEEKYQIIAKWNGYSGRHKIRIEPLSYCCTVDGGEELWNYGLSLKECEKLLQDYSIREKIHIRPACG